MSCGVGHRRSLDLAWLWLWLWCRPAATALIQPLAWELLYALGVALKRQTDRQTERRKERNLLLVTLEQAKSGTKQKQIQRSSMGPSPGVAGLRKGKRNRKPHYRKVF